MNDITERAHARNVYPHIPGSKCTEGSSVEAAQMMLPLARNMRERIYSTIEAAPNPPTADEIADRMGLSPFSVRPRCSELNALGRIAPAEGRGRNTSGATATRWRVARLGYGE